MSRNQEYAWSKYWLAISLGLAALAIATNVHSIVFTAPKSSWTATEGNGSSRAIVTRLEWDMSESKHIPDYIVLLSGEKKTEEQLKTKNGMATDEYLNYKYDGYFLGFGILFNKGLMIAPVNSMLAAGDPKELRGFDFVYQRPRLLPTDTTWHPRDNRSYRYYHLMTFGRTNIGVYRLTRLVDYSLGDPTPNPLEEDDEDEEPDETHKGRPSYRPRTTTSTIRPSTTGRSLYDEYGEPTPTPLPAKFWRIPYWKWTHPGETNKGEWVFPERPLLDQNCWAYSYASYHDGSTSDPRDPPKTRFWARWPVKSVDCHKSRPLCKFIFDSERAIPTRINSGPLKIPSQQGFPCRQFQDDGAPIFCSEEKNWSDQADPNKMELAYVIHRPRLMWNYLLMDRHKFANDFATDCYHDDGDEIEAFNLQNLSFILKNPQLHDKLWRG